MTPIVITLPWPDKELSPNARIHWRPKAVHIRAARFDAYFAALEVINKRPETSDGLIDAERLKLTWTFYPPNRARRDLDNTIGSCKAYQDGIASAIGVNDNKFESTYRFGDAGAGLVIVEIAAP